MTDESDTKVYVPKQDILIDKIQNIWLSDIFTKKKYFLYDNTMNIIYCCDKETVAESHGIKVTYESGNFIYKGNYTLRKSTIEKHLKINPENKKARFDVFLYDSLDKMIAKMILTV